MSKFKIGDKVQCVDTGDYTSAHIGITGTIVKHPSASTRGWLGVEINGIIKYGLKINDNRWVLLSGDWDV